MWPVGPPAWPPGNRGRPDPFAELEATEVKSEPGEEIDTANEPARSRAARPRGGFPTWVLVGGVLLGVAGVSLAADWHVRRASPS